MSKVTFFKIQSKISKDRSLLRNRREHGQFRMNRRATKNKMKPTEKDLLQFINSDQTLLSLLYDLDLLPEQTGSNLEARAKMFNIAAHWKAQATRENTLPMKYKLTFSEGTREEDSNAVAFTETKEDAEFIKALFESQGDRFKKCDFEPVDELPPKNECTFPLVK